MSFLYLLDLILKMGANHRTFACNHLTSFEYVVHAMTRTKSYGNMQKFGKYQYIPVGELKAIWSFKECCDFPTAGSSLSMPRLSLLMFLRCLGPLFIFSEIFTSGVL